MGERAVEDEKQAVKLVVRTVLIGAILMAMAAAVPARSTQPDPQPAMPPADDSVNSAPVTLVRDESTLQEVVGELAKQVSSNLTTGPESRFTQVSMRVRGRPALRVTGELARLLNYHWERNAERRTLRQGAPSRAYEENLRRRWFGGAADELVRYATLAKLPPEYYVRLNETLQGRVLPKALQGDTMEVVTAPSRHTGLQLLLALSWGQLTALVSAGEPGYYLPWGKMSSRQRELALQVADGMGVGRQWVQEMGLHLNVMLWPGTHHPSRYTVHMSNALVPCGTTITPPEALVGTPAARGCPYPPRDRAPTGQPPRADAVAPAYPDLEAMPFPARGFRQTYPSTWPETFARLGERLPYALYSDYFPAAPFGKEPSYFANDPDGEKNPPMLALERMSVAAGLDALSARYGKVWWREGDALFFRSRLWFLDRLYQMPPPVLTALQKQLQHQGKLDPRAVDLLASLTWEQRAGLDRLVQEKLKRWIPGCAPSMAWLLRAYSLLTEQQKKRVLGPGGLPFAQMTPAQRRSYQEALFLCDSLASLELVTRPPAFHFEQSVTPGVPGRQPSLAELSFMLADQAERRQKPRRKWPRLADIQVPFPAEQPGADVMERSR